jgi:hypothetical protein
MFAMKNAASTEPSNLTVEFGSWLAAESQFPGGGAPTGGSQDGSVIKWPETLHAVVPKVSVTVVEVPLSLSLR